MAKNKYIWVIGIFVTAGVLFFSISELKTDDYEVLNNFGGKITTYKSESCGCCSIYVNYFQRKGNSNVKIINTDDIDLIKKKYGVPSRLSSCHTTIIGDYFVEGHIPLDAVEKLLNEMPNIAGIAMQGMPSGSPGMPGAKAKDFVIYAVNHDGSYQEFMRI